MKKQMSIILGSTVAVAAAAAIAATVARSASFSTTRSVSTNVVNITFWNGHPSGALATQMHKEISNFNSSHPTIHVSYVDKYAKVQRVTGAMTAGDAPNVIMPQLDAAQQFATDGYLVNLSSFINGKDGFTKAQLKQDFYPAIWSSMNIAPGKQYVMPYEASSEIVIIYNKKLFAKVGIQEPPKTWNQVVTDAKRLSALGAAYHGISWTPNIMQFFAMVKDYGGQVWANPKHTQFGIDNSSALAVLTMLRGMVAKNTMQLTSGDNYQLDFGTGHVGFLIDKAAGWTYDLAADGGKFTMLAAPAPAGPSGKAFNYINGDSLAMLKTGNSAQQQAAWTFIKWLSSPQTNVAWNKATNYEPTGPAADKDMTSFYKAHQNYAATFSNPQNWLTDPAVNATQYYAAENALQSDFTKAVNGQESPAQALKNMNTIGNEYLSGQKRS